MEITEITEMRSTGLKLLARFTGLMRGEEGQDLVEYGLLCTLVSLLIVATSQDVAAPLGRLFTSVGNALTTR